MNAIILAQANCIVGHQFHTHSNGSRAGTNELDRRKLIDASGGDQGNLRKWNLERSDVLIASNRRPGNTLTKSAPVFHAAMTSVGVRAPGKTTTSLLKTKSTTS